MWKKLIVVGLCLGALRAQEKGVSWELAQVRAKQVSKVGYELWFGLEEDVRRCRGRVILGFDLRQAQDLVLDAELLAIGKVLVNGKKAKMGGRVRQVEDHLVLGRSLLKAGRNRVEIEFSAKAAPTGSPLTLFHDKKTGRDYLYTLVVPADAHRLFPCFDQPDLKAKFKLTLEVPKDWVAVGNGAELGPIAEKEGRRLYDFVESKPLPTYLFAFAAGPFLELKGPLLEGPGEGIPTRIFLRKSANSEADINKIYDLHAKALERLNGYFGIAYPFGKLDIVLCPGFPYSGMEHAGAIFYRENALIFDKQPTLSQDLRRSTLIYHEVTHQWFGNLVTMKWFDDLWLKEGFATFVGYKLLDELEPEKQAWLRFLQRVRPNAYRIDATRGTTPVYQRLGNLDDAKSQYGAIVYNKAPAVLRELEHRIGAKVFRKGLRIFLETHAFGNATWRDLLAAFEKAGAHDLAHWSKWWILEAGMPEIRCEWTASKGLITSFRILQTSAQGWPKSSWPLELDLLLMGKPPTGEKRMGDKARTRLITVKIRGPLTEVPQLVGSPTPAWILPNPRDIAYGRFLIDKQSQAALGRYLLGSKDAMQRAVGHAALYETLRAGRIAPGVFLDWAKEMLNREEDAQARSTLLSSIGFGLRCVPAQMRDRRERSLRESLLEGLRQGRFKGNEQGPIESLFRLGSDEASRAFAWQIIELQSSIVDFQPSAREIFTAATYLIANRDPRIDAWLLALETEGTWFEALGKGRPSAGLRHAIAKDLEKLLYIARAAHPDPRLKEAYFLSYLREDDPPEQWIELSLRNFHWRDQEDVTLLYLTPALERVQWVKKHRKIFFMPAWLDAFINGHDSAAALRKVEEFLERKKPGLPLDILRKLEQSLDDLRRVVRIRKQWYPR